MTTPDNLPNLPPPWDDLRRERIEKERLWMAKTRKLLATNNTARQEAIARFILKTADLAEQLQQAVATKKLMETTGTLRLDFDRHLWEIEVRILCKFRELFGHEMFPDPPLPNVADEMKQIREAREAERNRDPVPPT